MILSVALRDSDKGAWDWTPLKAIHWLFNAVSCFLVNTALGIYSSTVDDTVSYSHSRISLVATIQLVIQLLHFSLFFFMRLWLSVCIRRIRRWFTGWIKTLEELFFVKYVLREITEFTFFYRNFFLLFSFELKPKFLSFWFYFFKTMKLFRWLERKYEKLNCCNTWLFTSAFFQVL